MDQTNRLLEKIGANIKALRIAKGLQQKDVARMAGISVAQYGRLENGTTKASVVTIIQIAEALGVGIDLLVFGKKLRTEQEPVILKDKQLADKLKELDALSEDDKGVAHDLLDLLLAKQKFKKLAGDLGSRRGAKRRG